MDIIGLPILYIHGMSTKFALFCNFIVITHWDSLEVSTRVGRLVF